MDTLNFKHFGNGVPVIILHGLMGSLDNWQTFAKSLAKEYSVYIVDQRNHGRSPHSDVFNYSLLAIDLADFMDEEGIYQAHLVGHSMGGKTVMKVAEIYPDYVLSLTSIDIGPGKYTARHDHIYEALNAVPLDQIRDRKEAEKILSERISDETVVKFLLKNLKRKKNNGFHWKINLKSLTRNYDEIITGINPELPIEIPTLFVRGGESDYINDEDWTLIEEFFPNSSLVTVPKAGHWVHVDQPAMLEEEVLRFLEKVEGNV